MKFIPIIYSTAMVQAKLAKDKTQTRRTNGLEKINECPDEWELVPVSGQLPDEYHFHHLLTGEWVKIKSPYGQPGDILWTRETFLRVWIDHAHDLLEGSRNHNLFMYKASIHSDWYDYAKEKYRYQWKPNIHMPKTACRMWDKVVSIRPERLNDITEADAVAEGVESKNTVISLKSKKVYRNYSNPNIYCTSAKNSFQTLWYSINGFGSWSRNPWVWRIEFESLAEMPAGFLATKEYGIYDGRYLTDPESATLFEYCDTLKEARRNKKDYGTGNVIVEFLVEERNGNTHIISKSIVA